MATILVADNDEKSLDYVTALIRDNGFSIVRARTTEEAREKIQSGEVDVAVIDLRMQQDSDEHDVSGLRLAQATDQLIPKIIISSFASRSELIDALKVDVTGTPTIVSFVRKKEIPSHLLPAINHAMRLRRNWLSIAQTKVTTQLNEDYQTARKDARLHYWVTTAITFGFALLIFWGAMQLHDHGSLPVLFAVAGVLVAEVTNYILGKKLEFLYERVDRYHSELLETNRFDQLLEASFEIKSETQRDEFKRELFSKAASHWLRPPRPKEP